MKLLSLNKLSIKKSLGKTSKILTKGVEERTICVSFSKYLTKGHFDKDNCDPKSNRKIC